MDIAEQMGPVEAMIVGQRVMNAHNNIVQRLCWERCADMMHDWDGPRKNGGGVAASVSAGADEELPLCARQCIDICTSKYAETAMRVSTETQNWQMQQIRQQQMQSSMTKLVLGAGAAAAVAGLGWHLFRAGPDGE
eukprot:TRINITY_DN24551_c0_g1_i1.p1 TRINITY_DN24551_c0_g1~~TRINITY_DN24551_c0_g1_i1.p1  ORF type:complete len:136 (-),score=35.19 TRINITY_DN24551_c0_g1_i1:106-513(-)